MARYMGIEQTTDLRYPETRIESFTSRRAAQRWLDSWDNGFAWAGAARSDVSPGMQNWHHRLRTVHEMPVGWRPPTKREQVEHAQRYSTSAYRRRPADYIASVIRRDSDSELIRSEAVS